MYELVKEQNLTMKNECRIEYNNKKHRYPNPVNCQIGPAVERQINTQLIITG